MQAMWDEGLRDLQQQSTHIEGLPQGSSHQAIYRHREGERLAEMLQLLSHGGAKGGLQPYDMSLHGRVLHGLRLEVEIV